jgi:hypothetical protein
VATQVLGRIRVKFVYPVTPINYFIYPCACYIFLGRHRTPFYFITIESEIKSYPRVLGSACKTLLPGNHPRDKKSEKQYFFGVVRVLRVSCVFYPVPQKKKQQKNINGYFILSIRLFLIYITHRSHWLWITMGNLPIAYHIHQGNRRVGSEEGEGRRERRRERGESEER